MTGPQRHVPTADLRPGQMLARDLIDHDGRVLLRAFEPLSEPAIALAEAAGVELSLGRIGEEAIEAGTRLVPLVEVAAGELGERRVAQRQWRIDRELAKVRAQIRRNADAAVVQRQARWSRLNYRIQPEIPGESMRATRGRLVAPLAMMNAAALHDWRDGRGAILAQAYARLASGGTITTAPLDALIDECLDDLAGDPRLAARLALGAARGVDALVGHALGVGVLAIGVAIRMGWSREDVRAAALAGLLCDVGLTVLPTNIRALDRPLTEEEHNALRRHAVYGAAMLERVRASTREAALPESVQIAVYQHHERLDGTGYPTRARGEQVHDLARLVSACDVLLAMCEDRAHRPGLSPEAAMSKVVRQANAGGLDRAVVRALLSLLTSVDVRVVAGRRVAA